MCGMSNLLSALTVAVLLGGFLLTLVGASEMKSLARSKDMNEGHVKFHLTLISLSIAFPLLFTTQLIISEVFIELIKRGFWITYLMYDALAAYLYLHLREERKNESLGDITTQKVFKILYRKILDLFKA